MSSGATGARAVAGSQGVFTGQFDKEMNQHRLIGGESSVQQFDTFQDALSNASLLICKASNIEDVQSLINNMEEVVIKDPDMPDDSLLTSLKKDIYFYQYKKEADSAILRRASYLSNKASMCSVLRAQCDPAMVAKLEATEDWDAKKTDLLFVLEAAQAACLGVQQNYSVYVSARDAMRSLANCFQNTESAVEFKRKYLACKKLWVKAGISLKFSKKFVELEKKRNPKLTDVKAMEVAEDRFHGTMWLMNSQVPSRVTDNLVQDHVVGTDNYPKDVEQAYTMLVTSGSEAANATSLAQTYTNGDNRSSGGRGGRGGGGGPGRGAGRGGGRRPNGRNRCHNCGEGDHFISECTNPPDEWGRALENTEVANDEFAP